MAEERNDLKQGDAPFQWNKAKEEAALLFAQDELAHDQIAERVGTSRTTLWRWRKSPEFAARVAQNVGDIHAAVRSRGIAVVENRVRALQDRWDRMKRVIEERAKDPKMQEVPGGQTGLLVHDVKSVGAGTAAKRVDVYEVDTGLLKELREHEKQAAQELGQWTEKQEVAGSAMVVVKVLNGVSMSELH